MTGCSFGAYHAVNFAFRHPDKVTGCVTMAGSFDIKSFLDGWYSEDVYFNNPPDYLANCTDGWRYNHMRTVLATGEWDMCWNKNEAFAAILRSRGIRHELYVWGEPELSRLAVVAAHGADVSGIGEINHRDRGPENNFFTTETRRITEETINKNVLSGEKEF